MADPYDKQESSEIGYARKLGSLGALKAKRSGLRRERANIKARAGNNPLSAEDQQQLDWLNDEITRLGIAIYKISQGAVL
jgi:hypothetical protein